MKKISLQSLIFSFILSIAILKKALASNPHPFHKPRCLWNLQRENRNKPAFKLCYVLECTNESHFYSCRTIIHYLEKWNPQSKFILSTTLDYLAEFIDLLEIF